MKEILGSAKTVRGLLKGVKYDIDYYQREYRWQEKQVVELVDDLSGRFLEDFDQRHPREQVAEYGHYFLGSIIVSKKDGKNYIVDGQQRLTTLTLFLMFLRNLQPMRGISGPWYQRSGRWWSIAASSHRHSAQPELGSQARRRCSTCGRYAAGMTVVNDGSGSG
jgi:hypothetical protein